VEIIKEKNFKIRAGHYFLNSLRSLRKYMKKIARKLKLTIEAAKATPARPLGRFGTGKSQYRRIYHSFQRGTRKMAGDLVPVEVIVYEDKSFNLRFKTPPLPIFY